MIGSASTNTPTAQGIAIRPISRRDESCTILTPFLSLSVKWLVMAGIIAAVMQGMNASGKLKIV